MLLLHRQEFQPKTSKSTIRPRPEGLSAVPSRTESSGNEVEGLWMYSAISFASYPRISRSSVVHCLNSSKFANKKSWKVPGLGICLHNLCSRWNAHIWLPAPLTTSQGWREGQGTSHSRSPEVTCWYRRLHRMAWDEWNADRRRLWQRKES